MSHVYAQVLQPIVPPMPRGAALAAWLYGLLAAVARHAIVRPLTRAQEAAAVRELARQVQDSDPGFASDLMYAAARHESLDDEPASLRR